MDSSKKNGPLVDPGLCRCCLSKRKCRNMSFEYSWLGEKEVYGDMILDSFGLIMSGIEGSTTDRLICATCVVRLREATAFKRQVLRSEEQFLRQRESEDNDVTRGADKVKLEFVKLESESDSDRELERDGLKDGSDNDTSEEETDTLSNNINEDVPLSVLKDRKSKVDQTISATSKLKKDIPTAKSPSLKLLEHRISNLEKARASKLSLTLATRTPIRSGVSQGRSGFPGPMWASNSKASIPNKPPLSTTASKNIARAQQLVRETDTEFMLEFNAATIIEYSNVCPFKCKHNEYLCFYCGHPFSDPAELRQHTRNNHKPERIRHLIRASQMTKVDITEIDCKLCTERITDIETFRKHLVERHAKQYYSNCSDGVLPFRLKKNELNCTHCDKSFLFFHAINQHMNEHFSNYVCETCGLGFVEQTRLTMHKYKHESGKFPCPQCGKEFKTEVSMKYHIDRIHKKKGRIYCPKCNERFMSYQRKLNHLVEVHGEKPLSFPCRECDKVCTSRRYLTVHMKRDHLKDFRYECQYCGQKFFTKFSLTNHLPSHTGERNYKCKVCEKSYPRLKTLKEHMRIHNNDRRYRCTICEQAFIQNCSLKAHVKSQHPEYG